MLYLSIYKAYTFRPNILVKVYFMYNCILSIIIISICQCQTFSYICDFVKQIRYACVMYFINYALTYKANVH